MGVNLLPRAVELTQLSGLRGFVGHVDGSREDFPHECVAFFPAFGDRHCFRHVKQIDDFLARVVAQRTQKNGSQDSLFPVDLGVNEVPLLVDLKLQP